jgi:hypothetical protein
MRQPVIRFASSILAALCALTSHAQFDTKGWAWQRPVDTAGAQGFVRVSVPLDVIDASQASLNDLRVLDIGGNLVPHVVFWGHVRDIEKREWRPLKLLNATYQPGQFGRVTLDFGEPVDKNTVRVRASGENFRRRAALESSTDTLAWEMVAENLWLFDVRVPGQEFRADTFEFPTNNFRYLRLTVYNMPDDPRQVTIESAEGSLVKRVKESELVATDMTVIASGRDEKLHASHYEFDLGSRKVPVAAMAFQFADPYFQRAFEVCGRNSTTQTVERRTESGIDKVQQETPWQQVRSGVIYRIQEKDKTIESLKLDDVESHYRYLLLRVFNADNPPLKLDKATAWRRPAWLVFDVRDGKQYRLIYGNEATGAASYDLANSVRTLEDNKWPEVRLGAVSALAAQVELAPWSERNAGLMWVALALAVAATLFLILRNLKSGAPPAPPAGPDQAAG